MMEALKKQGHLITLWPTIRPKWRT
jgi:hypothetical protein